MLGLHMDEGDHMEIQGIHSKMKYFYFLRMDKHYIPWE